MTKKGKTLLRKKTVAENVLKYGTGGINIDESRIGTGDKLSIHKGAVGFRGSIGSITKERDEQKHERA